MAGIVIPYSPRPQQREVHDGMSTHRWGAVVAHRRFGKTVCAVNHLLREAIRCDKPAPRYAYLGPTYSQAKSVAWDMLKRYTLPFGASRGVNETELRIDLPGDRRIRLFGVENADNLRGLYLDGVVLDEHGLMDGDVWSRVIRPALADRKGWALFIGTPDGKNSFYEICEHARRDEEWYFGEFKASKTGIIDAEELRQARKSMTSDEYAAEFECSFEVSVKGAIYGAELAAAKDAGRIGRWIYDPRLPVSTAWDIGVGDATAVWFVQTLGNEVRLVDYLEGSGVGLDWYVKALSERGYTYAHHIGPHDLQVREFGSGRSRLETAASLGIHFTLAPNPSIDDGINAVRLMLPRMYFDDVKCAAGIDKLRMYRWAENKHGMKVRPEHDDASHAADALRYLALGLPEESGHRERRSRRGAGGSLGWMG